MQVRNATLVVALALCLGAGEADRPNGFDVANAIVARDSIVAGGPARDGIRSVDAPTFATPDDAEKWVGPGTTVLGVHANGVARAYPVHLLEYHQVVNDEIGAVPVAVTYDPLTSVPRVYRRVVEGKRLTFGVSGLVRNSGFLLFDRETETLWSQYDGRALAGPLAGKKLGRLRLYQEPVGAWLDRFPESQILSPPDSDHIDYRYSPFTSYWASKTIPFPVAARDERFHPKEMVLGVVVDGTELAYLGSSILAAGGLVEDEVGGVKLRILYDPDTSSFTWDGPDDLDVTESYWFAWKANHPNTHLWREPAGSDTP